MTLEHLITTESYKMLINKPGTHEDPQPIIYLNPAWASF